VKLNSVLGMELSEHRTHLGPEHSLQRDCSYLDQGDLPTELPRRGGHLASDPSPADHDNLGGFANGVTEVIGIRDCAQIVNAR
jgi:hypothetical protein